MKMYNVLIVDRHCDPEIHNFVELDTAVSFANQNAREFCISPDEL